MVPHGLYNNILHMLTGGQHQREPEELTELSSFILVFYTSNPLCSYNGSPWRGGKGIHRI